MGRMYVASFDNVAVSAAQDLISVQTDDDKVVIVHEAKFTQSSDAGDSESEQLRFSLKRGVGYTAGSGGASVNAQPLDAGDAADSATCRRNDTTGATAGGGSLTTLLTTAEHVQAGWHYLPTPELRPAVAGGSGLIFALDAAPTDALTMNGYVIFEEIG